MRFRLFQQFSVFSKSFFYKIQLICFLKCLSRRKRRYQEFLLGPVASESQTVFRNFFEKKKSCKTRYLNCLKEDKPHTNSDSSYSNGEQEVKRSAHEGQGGVKRQAIPVGNTDCQ